MRAVTPDDPALKVPHLGWNTMTAMTEHKLFDGITLGGNDAALARTIIALGDMLSLRTVAEGIEDAQQYRALRDLGGEPGQGYLFAKPLPPETFAALVIASRAGIPAPPPPVLAR